jgi:hypothetical protein
LPGHPLFSLWVINLLQFKKGKPTDRQETFDKFGKSKVLSDLLDGLFGVSGLLEHLAWHIQGLMKNKEELIGAK